METWSSLRCLCLKLGYAAAAAVAERKTDNEEREAKEMELPGYQPRHPLHVVPHIPVYRPPANSSSRTTTPHISSLYPQIGQPGQPAFRAPPYHQHPSHSSGTGIRVAIKAEYRISPPPPLSLQMGEISQSNFQFDFDLDKKILAEAEKENPNWSHPRLDSLPSRAIESTSSMNPAVDPVVKKFTAIGLN
ncbi:hypothetical protein Ancab_009157 [Ancistrocladus abbreviatus]